MNTLRSGRGRKEEKVECQADEQGNCRCNSTSSKNLLFGAESIAEENERLIEWDLSGRPRTHEWVTGDRWTLPGSWYKVRNPDKSWGPAIADGFSENSL